MIRCRTCLYPTTKPDLHFDETGECSACRAYKARPEIDWDDRKRQLIELLDKHHGHCIVPSSGGKDSTYQVVKLKELGAYVIAVTATTCHLTEIGRKNIDNLARIADQTIEVSPNKRVRATLNRAGLELVGDISWPEHVSIFTTPFKVARDIGVPLIFYGENPQNAYGGPEGSDAAMRMTRRWVSEFGGFLGLRPQDMIGQYGLTEDDMHHYIPLHPAIIETNKIEAHFLGQYIPWDSHENARIAKANGMIQELPAECNWWTHENLDNAQTGIHDYMMLRKYGYGRACGQLSVDVRSGRISREDAMNILNEREWRFPYFYAGVHLREVLDRFDMERENFVELIEKFTNKEIYAGRPDNSNHPRQER